MRLRRKPWIDEAIHDFDDFVFPKDRPATEELKGKWRNLFGNDKPLYVELGTGKGDFISQLAEREQEHNFIGIEAQQDVLYQAAVKVREKELSNVRLLVFDINEIETIFAPGEVDGFYINFCDPWPKAGHAKRRLVHRDFLKMYREIALPGGRLRFKTDNGGLFDFAEEELASCGMRTVFHTRDLHSSLMAQENVMTEYEAKFTGQGVRICMLEAELS